MALAVADADAPEFVGSALAFHLINRIVSGRIDELVAFGAMPAVERVEAELTAPGDARADARG